MLRDSPMMIRQEKPEIVDAKAMIGCLTGLHPSDVARDVL